MSKIGVVVPILNNFRGFAELAESIKSQHEVKWYIQPQHRHQIPLAAAWNKGLKDAISDGCEYIAILNDDILLSPKSLDNLVSMFNFGKDIVLVSANNIYGHINNPYDILTHEENDETTYSEHPNYSCFMVKSSYPETVGWFDENFNPAYYEDNDSHRRIQLLNYKAICSAYASCIHFGSITVKIDPSKAQSGESQSYYIRKWGGLPNSHPVADELKETFTHPYNDKTLTPKDWILGR